MVIRSVITFQTKNLVEFVVDIRFPLGLTKHQKFKSRLARLNYDMTNKVYCFKSTQKPTSRFFRSQIINNTHATCETSLRIRKGMDKIWNRQKKLVLFQY